MIVPINQVIPLDDSSKWAINKMKEVLQKQGQIEPLQVYKFEDKYIVFPDDPWGNEIVFAARELKWDTLLVVEMEHYDEE